LEEVNKKLSELKLASAKMSKLESELNLKRTELENKYTPELSKYKEQKLLIESDLELYAQENKNLFEGKRSVEMLHGSIGFRQSTKLSTLKGFKWHDVVERIKAIGGKFKKDYLRIKEEIAKDELKSDLVNGNLSDADARKICVELEQSDNFFIELNEAEA
jgi:phage host-nuclease inhibitor protein Gam